jgi:hypothetical protein
MLLVMFAGRPLLDVQKLLRSKEDQYNSNNLLVVEVSMKGTILE